MDTQDLKNFERICTFVSELNSIFGSKYHNVVLYNKLLEATPITNSIAIKKHLETFKQFMSKNKDAILQRDESKLVWDRIIVTNKVFIDFKQILKESDDETKVNIWNYFLTISYGLDPTEIYKSKLVELLNKKTDTQDNTKETEFLQDFMNKIEEKFQDKDFTDPSQATVELLQSGVFTDLMTNMKSKIENEEINVQKLLGSVSNILNTMPKTDGTNQNIDIGNMFNMVSSMMGGQAGGMNLGDLMQTLGNVSIAKPDDAKE